MRNGPAMVFAIFLALAAAIMSFIAGSEFAHHHKYIIPYIIVTIILLSAALLLASAYNSGGQAYKGPLRKGIIFRKWDGPPSGFVRLNLKNNNGDEWIIQTEEPEDPDADIFIVEEGKLIPFNQSSKPFS